MKETSDKTARRSRTAADRDEIQPEYDWSKAVRSPYASRFAAGFNIALLQPDVAALFTNLASVHEALRSLPSVMEGRKPKGRSRSRTA